MTSAEWIMLAAGLASLFAMGAWHLGGILLISRVKPSSGRHPHFSVLVTLWGLILLHVSEILLGAIGYYLALQLPWTGDIVVRQGSKAAELLYFSGITFATLGFTQQNVTGPVRLLVMLQSLGGFMMITWSATFVYTIWSERFRTTQG